MKTIEINIKNTEDIIYLDSINYNDDILKVGAEYLVAVVRERLSF